MSDKYTHGDIVPTSVIVKRLNELADAVTKGESGLRREFDMRIPAELDRDADLILSEAAMRLSKLEAENKMMREALENECGGRCNFEHNPCWAREILRSLNGFKLLDLKG